MPIHVNLYHEVQRQDLARRRDPLRLAMLAVLLIAIGFVVNYFIVLERSHSIGVRFAALNEQWSKISPQAKAAKARQDELNNEIAASDAMLKTVESRLYWAPVLDQVLKTIPSSVQLLHVGADSPGNDRDTISTLTVSGISSAAEPRKEAEAVRIALEKNLETRFKHVTSVFKELDDSDQFVLLNGRRLPTATFSLEFQIEVRDAVADASVPGAPHKESSSEAAE
ncbi:MAG TPA: hypothetical protein VHY22_03480 [Chthoniobacteraceae bacterium]|jgi:Tfp pilus assembly protein PilN|nr:hypothetical protein [Chthoniobacteraceae bacterium]